MRKAREHSTQCQPINHSKSQRFGESIFKTLQATHRWLVIEFQSTALIGFIFHEDVQKLWHIEIQLIPKMHMIGFVFLHIPPEIITIEIPELLPKDNHVTRKFIHLEVLEGAELMQKCFTFDIQTAPTRWILKSSATPEVFEEGLGGCFVAETFSGG